jgi:hypothetical protein
MTPLFAAVLMAAYGTKVPMGQVGSSVANGRTADEICSG